MSERYLNNEEQKLIGQIKHLFPNGTIVELVTIDIPVGETLATTPWKIVERKPLEPEDYTNIPPLEGFMAI